MSAIDWPWRILILLLLLLVLVVEAGREILFGHLLYNLNLHARARLKPLPFPAAEQKVLIFAPHEDDETLGCGGLIQRATAAGVPLRVALLTNGEYPELSVILFEETLRTAPVEFIRLGYRRQQESLTALRLLGLPSGAVTFFGYPNQYLNQMWLPAHWLPADPVRSRRTRTTQSPYRNSFTPHANYCGESMLEDVETLLLREQPTVVFTVHSNDLHVDHWPTGVVVRYALVELAARGVAFAQHCQVYTYLIHRDYWPVPRRYRPLRTLEPPEALVAMRQTDWYTLPLSLLQTRRKHQAIGCYRTQGGDYDPLLSAFARANELFGVEQEHTWPSAPVVPPATILDEPITDLSTAHNHPGGDILRLRLARQGDRLKFTIITRRPAKASISCHLSLHAGGAQPEARTIIQYDWQGTTATAQVVRGNTLHKLASDNLRIQHQGNETTLEAPWPLPDSASFFFLRAWTTHGRSPVDQTATLFFRVTPPAPITSLREEPAYSSPNGAA